VRKLVSHVSRAETASTRSPSKEYGNGARLDKSVLVRSRVGRIRVGRIRVGRIRVRWSRPLEGPPKTDTISREADGWYVAIACGDGPAHPLSPTGQEPGIDMGLKVFLITADGDAGATPRHYRQAARYLAKCQRRVAKRKQGGHRRRNAVDVLAQAHQPVRRQRSDFHHKTAFALVRQYDTIYVEAIQAAHVSRRPAPKPAGRQWQL